MVINGIHRDKAKGNNAKYLTADINTDIIMVFFDRERY